MFIKHSQYTYFYTFSRATLNETFTAKYGGVWPRTPYVRPKSEIYTPKRDDEYPHPFICGVPPPPPPVAPVNVRVKHPISEKEGDRRVLLQNQVLGSRNSTVTFCHQSPSKFFAPSSGFYPNCFKPTSNRNQKLMSKAMGGITVVKPGRKSGKWQACDNMNMCENLNWTNQTKQCSNCELYEDYSFIQLNLPKRINKCWLLWFASCLGVLPIKFRNIFRYKQVERSCNV